MKVWQFEAGYVNQRWLDPLFVTVDQAGLIAAIGDQPPSGDHQVEQVRGLLLPGIQNAHSHAFQYAMAGLAEHLPLGAQGDDFWSWRETMYDLALRLSPDQLEHVAAMLYAEMLAHGYTGVVEFHYLHHAPDGKPYEDLAEMSLRVMRAAQRAGIQLTLVPIYYRCGDFGKPAGDKQRRFISPDRDAYLQLQQACARHVKDFDQVLLGTGLHSLRAVPEEDIPHIFGPGAIGPRHIHIAEQMREVEACLAAKGKRPVSYLRDLIEFESDLNLVHATHLSEEECQFLAESPSYVVLCPSTEGNLGDGHFPLYSFVKAGGNFSIGTDSHIGLNPNEELRWLDYDGRLERQRRNIMCVEAGQDSGRQLFEQALSSGRAAMGMPLHDGFVEGEPFSGVVVNVDHPLLTSCPADRRLSTIVYTCDRACLLGTIRAGDWVVKQGHHVREAEIHTNFAITLKQLRE